ncbi:MAG: hypothetical protein EBZ59_04845 [Planctomycetia bacterium]|nr:hypothetical protein [Planctomycetia bacterium]
MNVSRSGTIQLTGGTIASGTLTSTGTFFDVQNGAISSVLRGSIGTLGLVKSTSGTVTLSGVNAYTGTNSIVGGVLQLGNASALGAASNSLSIGSSGTLNLGGVSPTVGLLTGTAGSLITTTAVPGTATLTVNSSGSSAYGGAISDNLPGVVGLAFTGGGLMTLSGTSDYSGGTTLSSGTLFVTSTGALGAIAGNVSVGGGTLDLGNLSIARSGTVSITGSTAMIQSGTFVNSGLYDLQSGTIPASLTLAGSGSLAKTTTNLVTLSGSNGYLGSTTVSSGTLLLGNAFALGDAASLLSLSGGILNLGGNSVVRTGVVTIAGGTVTNGTLTQNGGNFDLQSGTVPANLAGTGSVIKSTAGLLSLTGTNSYTGGTQINGGILSMGSPQALGTSGTIVFGSGTLQFASSGTTDYSSRFSTGVGQAFNLDATTGVQATLGSSFGGAGGTLTKTGLGTVVLSASRWRLPGRWGPLARSASVAARCAWPRAGRPTSRRGSTRRRASRIRSTRRAA